MTFYYEGIARLDWGFGNPNRTAALIACLMIGVWALAYFKKWGFLSAWILSTVIGILLVQTFSRGGFLAAAVGGILLILFARRPWPSFRASLIAASIGALVIYAFVLSASERVAASWQGDPSVLNRLELWKSVPQMIADSPSGWGLHNAQNAYMQWYQNPERPERFLNLVSLHFTLLAELPWVWRIAYSVTWSLAFVITFPTRRLPELAAPFAVVSTFFVAGVFTHFAGSWPVYLPALLAVLAAIALRIQRNQWPSRRAFATAGAVALLVFLPVFFAGTAKPPVHGNSRRVVIGSKTPDSWILVSRKVLGGSYGKTYRKHAGISPEAPSRGFAVNLKDIPPTKTLVLCGKIDPASLPELRRINPQHIVLLNTNLFPAQVRQQSPAKTEAIFGEFADSNSLSAWRQASSVILIPGEGNFLSSWPDVLARQPSHH